MTGRLEIYPPGTLAQIDVQGQRGAVQAYIDYKLSQLREEDDYDDETKAKLSKQMRERCNRIFLWVALVFRTEIPKWDPWDALEALSDLPSDLTKLYGNLLAKIEGQSGNTPKYCKDVLIAVCLVRRPVSLEELGVCANIPPRIPKMSIALKCGSFLSVKDRTVYPIHQSAREYLQDNYMTRFWQGPGQGHLELFQRSIQYISAHLKMNMYAIEYDTLVENVQPCSDDQLAPMRYSCEYWVDHLRLASLSTMCGAEVISELFRFLQTHLLHWIESMSLIRAFQAGVESIQFLVSLWTNQKRLSKVLGKSSFDMSMQRY